MICVFKLYTWKFCHGCCCVVSGEIQAHMLYVGVLKLEIEK